MAGKGHKKVVSNQFENSIVFEANRLDAQPRPFHIVTPSDRDSRIIPGTLGEVMVRIDVNVRSLFRY